MTEPSTPPHHAPALQPSRWIERFAPLAVPGARVLDLACGHGRHARLFAARGCDVLAVDRDASALASLHGVANVTTRALDLETGTWPLGGERFDAIVVVNYLHRPSLPHILAALVPDGLLLYETFCRGNEAFGRPTNPDFLLAPGELLRVAEGRLAVVAFEQGHVSGEGRDAVVQRIAAVGLGRAAPARLPAG